MRFSRVRSLVLLAALLCSSLVYAQARDAVLRKRLDQHGDLVFAGNSVHTCSGQGCTTARTTRSSSDDNDFTMVFIDADGNTGAGAATFNSSMAHLDLPANAQVSWARLYWMCTHHRGTAPPDDTKRNQVQFRVGTGAYQTITAATGTSCSTAGATSCFDDGLSGPSQEPYGDPYMGQADVTSLVTGSADYWLANMQCSSGTSNLWSGWTIAVIYSLPSAPVRTISVFDAYDQFYALPNGHDVTLHLNGFVTPGAGPVTTKVGLVLGDGDAGYTGDSIRLNGTALSDANNPADNIANSSVSPDTTRNPHYLNTLGFDQDILSTTNVLPNGAMSATILAHSDLEHVFVGILSFSTDIFAPSLDTGSAGGKTATDVTHPGEFRPGDIVTYTINIKNAGQDTAIDSKLFDTIPPNTTYVANSITIGGVAKSDAAGDDAAEFDGANNRIVARIGTGATSTQGGSIAVNATAPPVSFQVKINGPSLANGLEVDNQASLDYAGQTLGSGIRYQGLSDGDGNAGNGNQPTKFLVTSAPDIHVAVTDDFPLHDTNLNGQLDPGEEDDFTITVTNTGDDTGHGVVITSPLDPNLVIIEVDSSGPNPVISNGVVTVNVGDLPVGGSVTITIKATVKEPFPVSGGGQVGAGGSVTGTNFTEVDGSLTVPVKTGCECFIEGVGCVGSGITNAQNSCQICDPLNPTMWSPVPGNPTCDDGKACTSDEKCDNSGNCVGTPGSACNDGLACTADGCNQDGTCANPIDSGSCVIDGACVAAGSTDPASPCHECIPASSQTGYSNAPNGQLCDTGRFCSTGGMCNDSGACVGTPVVCDDHLDCTADVCDEGSKSCTATITTGCVIEGVCVPTGATNPNNLCQVCNPDLSMTGWSSAQKGASCSTGSKCTDDTCDGAGSCTSTPKNCNDPVDCTIDSCNMSTGDCEHAIPPDTCVIEDKCVPTGTVNPTNACRICTPATSTVDYSNASPGTTCDDGLACTTNDECNANGVCVGTATCDDMFTCTLDTCTADGCQHTLAPGFCLIDLVCVPGGNKDPADACKACQPAKSTTTWTHISGCGVEPDGGSGGAIDAGGGGGAIDAGGGGTIDAGGGGGTIDAGGGGGTIDAGGGGGTIDAGGGGGTIDAPSSGGPPDAAPAGPIDARLADATVPDARPSGAADARVSLDAKPPADARGGTPLEPDKGIVEGGGCDCRVADGGQPPYGGLLLVGLVALIKRRRRS